MQCDTPVYESFVDNFLTTQARDGQQRPAVTIARKFTDSWPLPPKGADANAQKTQVRIGVLDSSFNPPHYCHGAYLECMGTQRLTRCDTHESQILGLDSYLLLLGTCERRQGADGPIAGAASAHVACDKSADTWHVWMSQTQFDRSNLDNIAIGMVNCARFVDKCQAVRELVARQWQQATGVEVEVLSYFTMGWDTLIRFFDPKYYSDFPADIDRFFALGGHIAFSRRIGFPDSDVEEFFAQPCMEKYAPHIVELKLPKRVEHVSSTDARLAIRDSTEGVQDLPPRILEFINYERMYRGVDRRRAQK
ncbi:hypothetical protein DL89DRAFT_269774 [Linderina pennispora]|uniref:Nucleotidylyl transferase n=1 Tax=Linderina pennispora TaxID=61395 RepID=A0A1Y1VZN8_9FUNG|nr:uncharacterized protein DL89DRAFT_269774 [Linderina pennispora]ORX66737.1 hypothetical protein DL89DRAFT_269774 [Linderina pennispora]